VLPLSADTGHSLARNQITGFGPFRTFGDPFFSSAVDLKRTLIWPD